MMNTSPEIGKLAEALAAAQLDFEVVKKDSDNPYYSSKYADLSSVIGATQPALAKNGLVVIQSPIIELEQQRAGVATTLAHSSGQWMSDELLLPATMKAKDGTLRFDAQSAGSAITYARRYTYQSMVGVAAEVDDDGNKASGVESDGRGTRQAAHAVATKKVAEAAPDTHKTVMLKELGDGMVSIYGDGISVVLLALGDTGKAQLGMEWHGPPNGWAMPQKSSFALEDICKSQGVGFRYAADSAKEESRAPTNVSLPPGHGKITNTELATGTKGPFMRVWQAGNKMQCFENHQMQLQDGTTIALFTLLKTAKGQEAVFRVNKAGNYLNIVGVAKLGRYEWDETGAPVLQR